MELIIYNPQIPELIKFNNEELIKELTEKLGHYNNLTYTDSEIKTAKTDRATLNKFKAAIETRRKEIKSQCLKPYEDFEGKVKQIVKMIDQPILAIDGQVKAFEEKVKTDKGTEIEEFYFAAIGDLITLLPLAKIWNDKWLNAATTMKSIKEDIKSAIDRVNDDLEILTNIESDFSLQVKDVYLRTLNLSTALQERTRLEDQKAKQEAYDKAQAIKREQENIESERRESERLIKAEIDEKAAEEKRLNVELEISEVARLLKEEEDSKIYEPVVMAEQEPEKVIEVAPIWVPDYEVMHELKVVVTGDLLEALEGFLISHEIKYERML